MHRVATLVSAVALISTFSATTVAAILDCDGTGDPDDVWVGRVYYYTLLPTPHYYATNKVGCCIYDGESYSLNSQTATSGDIIESYLYGGGDEFHTNISTCILCGSAGSPRIYPLPSSSPWDEIEMKIYGGSGIDFIEGGPDDDEIHGGDGVDYLWGGGGDDEMFGEGSSDVLWGQTGADTLWGDYDGCEEVVGECDAAVDCENEDWLFGGNGCIGEDDTLKGCGSRCDYLDAGECPGGSYDDDYCDGGEPNHPEDDYDWLVGCETEDGWYETSDEECAYYPYL